MDNARIMSLILHDYQKLAVDFLHHQPRAGLFLDMGRGKTAVTLSALTPERLPALVVAPKRVAEHVWPVERKLWRADLTMALAAGTPAQRAKALADGADITVISRDNLADALSWPYRTLIIDELSGFKDRSTNRWKAARKLAERVENCWGLTGTPSPNGLMDLWAQVYLLDRGARLGKNITTFRSRYFYPGRQIANGVVVEWNLRPESADRIHELLSDICLSMEGEMEMPTAYNTVLVPMPPAIRKLYKEFKRDLVVDLDVIGGEIHSAGNAAVLTGRLSQMTAGFIYGDDDTGTWDELHKEKINALQEVVDGTGDNILVFYRFKAELAMIKRAFPQARGIDEPGTIEAWNRGEVALMLAHPASAGHGLNLQHGGHTVVWTTLTWSLEEWQQGNARIARQGQKHPVVVHTLQMENSVDAVIRDRLDSKNFTQHALLEHLESPM